MPAGYLHLVQLLNFHSRTDFDVKKTFKGIFTERISILRLFGELNLWKQIVNRTYIIRCRAFFVRSIYALCPGQNHSWTYLTRSCVVVNIPLSFLSLSNWSFKNGFLMRKKMRIIPIFSMNKLKLISCELDKVSL